MPNGNGTVSYKAIVMLLTGALIGIVGILYNNMASDIKQLQAGQTEIRLLIAVKGNVSEQVPMTKTLDDILNRVNSLQLSPTQPTLGIQNTRDDD